MNECIRLRKINRICIKILVFINNCQNILVSFDSDKRQESVDNYKFLEFEENLENSVVSEDCSTRHSHYTVHCT